MHRRSNPRHINKRKTKPKRKSRRSKNSNTSNTPNIILAFLANYLGKRIGKYILKHRQITYR